MIVNSSAASIGPAGTASGFASVTASCPAGKVPLGGGYQLSGAVGDIQVVQSRVNDNATGFNVIAINTGSSSGSVSVRATCANVG